MRHSIVTVAALGLLSTSAAHAWVHEGGAAPAFTKNTLAGGPPWSVGPAVSLGDFAGKVVVLFLLGCT